MKNVLLTPPFTWRQLKIFCKRGKMWVLNFEYLKFRSSVCFQQSSTLPLSIQSISNKRHKCLGSKDSLLFWRNVFFIKLKCLSNIIMNIEHPVAINYCNDLFDTTWAHSQQNIGLKDQGTSPRPSPAGDRQCRQGRPPPDSGRSSSTWGGRWWTWWGRLPDCTCRYHWLASRRSWWEDWEGGPWGSWLAGAAAGPGCCRHSPGDVAQSSLGAVCRPRHWLCRSAYSRCGTSRRPANTEIVSRLGSQLASSSLIRLIWLKWFVFRFLVKKIHIGKIHLHATLSIS